MMNTHPSAPLWRRLAALLYDLLILTALSFAYSALATAIAVLFTAIEAENYLPMFQGIAFPLGWAATLILFYCWFWHGSGQTIGMKTWKIRLTNARDSDSSVQKGVPWHQCLLRSVIAAPCVLLAGIGYWYALIDPRKRCLHDRLSGTHVVYDGADSGTVEELKSPG